MWPWCCHEHSLGVCTQCGAHLSWELDHPAYKSGQAQVTVANISAQRFVPRMYTMAFHVSMNTTHICVYPRPGFLVSCGRVFHHLCHHQWISPLLSIVSSFRVLFGSSLHGSFVTLNFPGCLSSDLVVIAPSSRLAALPFIIRDLCGESTCFRCRSHLSPDFRIRGFSPSASIYLLVVWAHLLFLAN